MADSSSFSIGDIGTALGSFLKGTGNVFKDQVLAAGEKKVTSFSQSILNGLSKATQSTSNMLGLSHPSQLSTPPPPANAGQTQISTVKILGVVLTTKQLFWVSALGGATLVTILVWMSTRS